MSLGTILIIILILVLLGVFPTWGHRQRLGVWAFWNCRPHSHRGHHLGSAGSAVISFSEAQLSAAGFQAYRAEG